MLGTEGSSFYDKLKCAPVAVSEMVVVIESIARVVVAVVLAVADTVVLAIVKAVVVASASPSRL